MIRNDGQNWDRSDTKVYVFRPELLLSLLTPHVWFLCPPLSSTCFCGSNLEHFLTSRLTWGEISRMSLVWPQPDMQRRGKIQIFSNRNKGNEHLSLAVTEILSFSIMNHWRPSNWFHFNSRLNFHNFHNFPSGCPPPITKLSQEWNFKK